MGYRPKMSTLGVLAFGKTSMESLEYGFWKMSSLHIYCSSCSVSPCITMIHHVSITHSRVRLPQQRNAKKHCTKMEKSWKIMKILKGSERCRGIPVDSWDMVQLCLQPTTRGSRCRHSCQTVTLLEREKGRIKYRPIHFTKHDTSHHLAEVTKLDCKTLKQISTN